jgi:signal transduction histidine kinase
MRPRQRGRTGVGRSDDLRLVRSDDAVAAGSQYRQSVRRFLPLLRRFWFDTAVVAGIVLGIGEALLQPNAGVSRWFELVATVAVLSPLLVRRRFPFGAPVAVGVALAVASFFDHSFLYDLAPASAGVAAVFLVGTVAPRSRALIGLALTFGVVAVATHNDPGGGVDDFAAIALGLAPVWLLGAALRRKQEEAQLAVADERARIARELHDVVGHNVSVMTVQAAAVRRLLRSDQGREREALLAVERSGREAMAEMRRMVGVLRHAGDKASLTPQPSLSQLGKLVEKTRRAGLPVDLLVEGTAIELSPGVDLAAYRVVQEGLTNALKHSRATRAEVRVRYGDGQVEVSVTNDGRPDSNGRRTGHGLVGMRERVAVYGGQLEAGPQPSGRFRLRARLPAAPT